MTRYATPPDEIAPPGVSLQELLDLERLDRDLFRATVVFEERYPLFGGQVAAQALVAAGRTVDADRTPDSLHGYFLRPGDSSRPVVFAVDRDRDGRSFSARRVVALQDGEVILNLSTSFAVPDPDADDVAVLPAPAVEPVGPQTPEQVPPRLVDVAMHVPDQPYGQVAWPTRTWFRCTADLPADPLTDAAVLTYVSDLFTGAGGLPESSRRLQSSVDHAMWFHRSSPVGEWVLMDLHPRAVSLGRAFYTGELWRPDGTLAASLAQETLYRRRRR